MALHVMHLAGGNLIVQCDTCGTIETYKSQPTTISSTIAAARTPVATPPEEWRPVDPKSTRAFTIVLESAGVETQLGIVALNQVAHAGLELPRVVRTVQTALGDGLLGASTALGVSVKFHDFD